MKYPKEIECWPVITMYGHDFRNCLLNMANAITQLELWDWLKNFEQNQNEGFMFSSDENVIKIGDSVISDGHSGATFAYCIRCMQSIAKKGFESLSNN